MYDYSHYALAGAHVRCLCVAALLLPLCRIGMPRWVLLLLQALSPLLHSAER